MLMPVCVNRVTEKCPYRNPCNLEMRMSLWPEPRGTLTQSTAKGKELGSHHPTRQHEPTPKQTWRTADSRCSEQCLHMESNQDDGDQWTQRFRGNRLVSAFQSWIRPLELFGRVWLVQDKLEEVSFAHLNESQAHLCL